MSVADEQFASCGITWQPIDVESINASPTDRSSSRFVQSLPDIVWNTAALEGNTFTLPEVRTLLDGVTVGGKARAEETQILDLSAAYNLLISMVSDGQFDLSKTVSDSLHWTVAHNEAIEAGHFRGEGTVGGGGNVRLANGGMVTGRDSGSQGLLLVQAHRDLLDYVLSQIDDPREQALAYFAAVVRAQLYFDGNKRTARLMMTGHLMQSGFESVSIPWARRFEFNTALDVLSSTDDATDLMAFLATCALP